jgi:hypothetical protein
MGDHERAAAKSVVEMIALYCHAYGLLRDAEATGTEGVDHPRCAVAASHDRAAEGLTRLIDHRIARARACER